MCSRMEVKKEPGWSVDEHSYAKKIGNGYSGSATTGGSVGSPSLTGLKSLDTFEGLLLQLLCAFTSHFTGTSLQVQPSQICPEALGSLSSEQIQSLITSSSDVYDVVQQVLQRRNTRMGISEALGATVSNPTMGGDETTNAPMAVGHSGGTAQSPSSSSSSSSSSSITTTSLEQAKPSSSMAAKEQASSSSSSSTSSSGPVMPSPGSLTLTVDQLQKIQTQVNSMIIQRRLVIPAGASLEEQQRIIQEAIMKQIQLLTKPSVGEEGGGGARGGGGGGGGGRTSVKIKQEPKEEAMDTAAAPHTPTSTGVTPSPSLKSPAPEALSLVKQEPSLAQPSLVSQAPSQASIVVKQEPSLVSQAQPSLVSQAQPSLVSQAQPSLVSQAPSLVSQAPSLVSQAPSQASIVVKQEPSLVSQAPSLVSQAPSLVSQAQPSLVSQAPSLVSQAPSLVSQAPSLVSQAPSQASIVVKQEPSQAQPSLVSQAPVAQTPSQTPSLATQTQPSPSQVSSSAASGTDKEKDKEERDTTAESKRYPLRKSARESNQEHSKREPVASSGSGSAQVLMPYNLFYQEVQPVVLQANPKMSSSDVSRIISMMWNGLGEENKQNYYKKHEQLKCSTSGATTDQSTETAESKPTVSKLQPSRLDKQAAQSSKQAVKSNRSDKQDKQGPIQSKKRADAELQSALRGGNVSHQATGKGGAPDSTRPQEKTSGVGMEGVRVKVEPPEAKAEAGYTTPVLLTVAAATQVRQEKPRKLCVREQCTNEAIFSELRGDEYCSNKCVVEDCRLVFQRWVSENR